METTFSRLLAFDQEVHVTFGLRGFPAGVDEAGRGPLAGPVVAAAVVFIRPVSFQGLNDSKQVSPSKRELLYQQIIRHSWVGLGIADEEEIDKINIYQASRLAMKRAVLSLGKTPELLLIDGKAKIDLPLPQKTVVRGDARSASIAAASIVAKVYRDAWMRHLDSLYPEYAFKAHKGYGTKVHLRKIQEKGPSPVHRKTFAPVRACLEKGAVCG